MPRWQNFAKSSDTAWPSLPFRRRHVRLQRRPRRLRSRLRDLAFAVWWLPSLSRSRSGILSSIYHLNTNAKTATQQQRDPSLSLQCPFSLTLSLTLFLLHTNPLSILLSLKLFLSSFQTVFYLTHFLSLRHNLSPFYLTHKPSFYFTPSVATKLFHPFKLCTI